MTSTSTFCHILIRPRARLASRNRIDTLELHLGVGRNEHLRRLLFVGTPHPQFQSTPEPWPA